MAYARQAAGWKRRAAYNRNRWRCRYVSVASASAATAGGLWVATKVWKFVIEPERIMRARAGRHYDWLTKR